VAEKLDGNVNFPSPPTTPVDLAAKADTLSVAIAEATNGRQAARAARDARVTEVRGILRSMADYVRMVAHGDAAKLTTSGFELAKRPEPVGVPGMARDMQTRITNGKGVLELRWRTGPTATW
jgi:hypothetical protein